MKRWLAAMVAVTMSLVACGTEDDTTQQILRRYETMERCTMEAVVRCEYENESREYTLGCKYEAGGESRVTVHEPEGLQGLSIVFHEKERKVMYEDLVLDAPGLGKRSISAADVLPRLMDAVKQGWLLEEMTQQEAADTVRYMVFETEENGVKLYWTVLFEEETGMPCYAELSEDNQLFFTIEFTNFSFDDIITPTTH